MNRNTATLLILLLAALMAATAIAQRNTQGSRAPGSDDSGLMDVNSAPPEWLMTLPNIDLMLAKKIIAGRPYKAKTDLVTKKVLPQSTYDAIAARITARPAKAPPASKGKKR